MHVASSEGPQAQSFPVPRLNIEVYLMGDSGFKGFGPCDNEANCLRLFIGGTRTSGPSLVNATPFGQESLSNPAVTLDQKTPPDDPVFEFFLLGRVRVCVGVCIDTGSRADFRLFRCHWGRWRAVRPDLGERWSSSSWLAATASENRLNPRRMHTSFAAASDCRTIAIL